MFLTCILVLNYKRVGYNPLFIQFIRILQTRQMFGNRDRQENRRGGGRYGPGGRLEQDGGEPMEAYSPRPVDCPNCSASFYIEGEYQRHVSSRCSYRPLGDEHSCYICRDFKTRQYPRLVEHREFCPLPDGRSMHSCPCGQRIYTTITGFQRHTESCTQVPPRALPMPVICGRCLEFNTQSLDEIESHRRECNGEFPELIRGQPMNPNFYGEGEQVVPPMRLDARVQRGERIGRGLPIPSSDAPIPRPGQIFPF